MKSLKIRVAFKDDFITRVAGERLRHEILRSTEKGEALELDFSDLKVGSVSFFDESIAKLILEGWTKKDLEARVTFRGLYPLDRKVLESAMEYRGWSEKAPKRGRPAANKRKNVTGSKVPRKKKKRIVGSKR
jgi:hypothetical protein